jgi:nucleotide-binding universal stress UspA family protein
MNKILVPVDFSNASRTVVHQAAFLARHFHSEIILLHVLSSLSYPTGLVESGDELTVRDLHAETVQQAQKDLDQSLPPELAGITVKRLLLKGDAAREILETARNEKVDLIMMSSHGHGSFYRLLLGSVAAKVLHDSDCSVWTDAHVEEAPAREFTIRNVLCAVDLKPHSRHTVSRAAEFAAAFNASLTLVHITSSVETFGPGGSYVDPVWKETVVGLAANDIAKLQQDAGTKAAVIIDSGNVRELLNRAAKKTNADVLVVGHMPVGGHLGQNGSGYGIILESHIPVLSL